MRIVYLVLFTCLLVSCNNKDKSGKPSSEVKNTEETIIDTGETARNKKEILIDRKEEQDVLNIAAEDPEISLGFLPGVYHKIHDEKTGTTCNCNCIEINFEAATEWCLVADDLYMKVMTTKIDNTVAEVYFIAPSPKENSSTDLPWDKFDTTTPVATIQFQPDGTAQLDWLGFSIDDKIATEYALFGKKALEGTYRKQ